ncbi:predicted protein [Naegleria gruberi]|uniref:Predicted protein n=1 Tax=Naegleria gruberi TaxID=5762 RepID=D2VVP5_NAEGR|nr:uncharacterized protein NAEGRDRAFT_52635 [Naegleria gruberi]EFC39141.1 predicted protein [Naegleria gruberi]|eukprot:XP_002671885.1 predicted protein [Naegleria gruberi strain NEG-M]
MNTIIENPNIDFGIVLSFDQSLYAKKKEKNTIKYFLSSEILTENINPFLDTYDLIFGLMPALEKSFISREEYERSLVANFKNSLPSKNSQVRFEEFIHQFAFRSLKRVLSKIPLEYIGNSYKSLIGCVDEREREACVKVCGDSESLSYFLLSTTTYLLNDQPLSYNPTQYLPIRLWLKLNKKIIYQWRSLTFTIPNIKSYFLVDNQEEVKNVHIDNVRWNVHVSIGEQVNWGSDEEETISIPARLCDSVTLRKVTSYQSLIQLRFNKNDLCKKLELLLNHGISPSNNAYVKVTQDNLKNVLQQFFQDHISKLQEICSAFTKRSSSYESPFERPWIIPKWIQVRGDLQVSQSQSLIKHYIIDVQDFDILETVREKQTLSNLRGNAILKNIQHFLSNPEELSSRYIGSLVYCKEATLLDQDVRDNKRLTLKVEPYSASVKLHRNLWERTKGLFSEFNPKEVLENNSTQLNVFTLYHIHPKLFSNYNLLWPNTIGRIRPLKFLLKPGDLIEFKGRLLDTNQILAYDIRLNSPYLFISTPAELVNIILYKGSLLSLSLYLTYKLYKEYMEYLNESPDRSMPLSQFLATRLTIEIFKLQIGLALYYLFINWPSLVLKCISDRFSKKVPGMDKQIGKVVENISALILFVYLIEAKLSNNTSFLHRKGAELINGYLIWIARRYLLFFGYRSAYQSLPSLYSIGKRVVGYARQKFYQARWFVIDTFFNKPQH